MKIINEKNKGFTLVELLGVIALIGLVALLAFPPVLNQIKKARSDLSSATEKIIVSNTELFMDENKDAYPSYTGSVYCITLEQLVNDGKMKAPIKDAKTEKELDLSTTIQATILNRTKREYKIVTPEECSKAQNNQ